MSRTVFIIEFPHRGRVTWDNGTVVVDGERDDRVDELREAVMSLLEMEDVDLGAEGQVKTALLSMAGARIVRDTRSDGHRQ